MDSKEFKIVFGEIAKENNYLKAFGGWYLESSECLAVLELQKSTYGDYYMLNIKVFIQGSFDREYHPTKQLIKSPIGDVTKQVIDDILALDRPMSDDLRIEKLKELFKDTITPFVSKLMTKRSIIEAESKGEIKLLSSVKKELEKLLV
ncbi:DUF4304 domain-containing protein [Chryseobacterium indologenes]|uniref:DUF4304 domain-containing protein n=1 Tax=Chryseobacterium indologenes TaxID=253 RepID=A0A0N0ZST0_CHRID|nr:DUF4304 domain-containing protein [Chryseobacterium indologenes]KPE49090.1 hypothetical protein AOB46_21850 [Chryseobacterium indologenes]